MISGSSVVSALLLYSSVVILVWLLRLWSSFLGKGGVTVLLLASAFAAARLLLPIEIPVTYAIRSWTLLATPQLFLRNNPDFVQAAQRVWIIGAVLVTGWDILILCLARKSCRSYRVVENERVQQIAERIGVSCPVKVSPDVEVPFVAGILHHTIYFPEVEFSDQYIELILSHEEEHVRGHDALIKLFFGILSAVMWWTLWFRGVVDSLLEMRCDAMVTKGMSEEKTQEYMQMLTDMTKRVVSHRRVPALSLDEFSTVGKKKSAIGQRFRVMNARARKGNLLRSISTLMQWILPLLFLASYLVIIQPAGVPSEEVFQNDSRAYYVDNYDGPDIGNEATSTFIIKGPDGRYQLFVNYRFTRYLTEDEVTSGKYKDSYVFEEARER